MLFHIDQTEPLWTYPDEGRIRDVDISADGSLIVAGSSKSSGSIYLFNNSSNTTLWTTQIDAPEEGWWPYVEISPNGEYVVARLGGVIYFLDIDNGGIDWSYDLGGDYFAKDIDVNDYGDVIVGADWDDDNTSVLFFKNGDEGITWNHTIYLWTINSVIFSENGQHIGACRSGYDNYETYDEHIGEVNVFTLSSNESIYTKRTVDESGCGGIALSNNADFILHSGGYDGDTYPLYIYSREADSVIERESNVLLKHSSNAVSFEKNGKFFVMGTSISGRMKL